MKVYGNKGIANIIKIVLQISMVIGLIFLIMLYWLAKWFKVKFNLFIMMIYPCGLGLLYLIYQFIGLFNTLKQDYPFCIENVTRMKKGMYASLAISLFIIIALLLTIFAYNYYSLQLQVALFFMAILFLGVGIALYILAELFIKAITYKEENDLTI